MSEATGKIVFISSVHEIIPWAFQVNYAASREADHLKPAIRVSTELKGRVLTRFLISS
jgi:hypothetical protein